MFNYVLMCVSTCEFVHMGEVFWGMSEPLEMEFTNSCELHEVSAGTQTQAP